ncbi:MAG: PAS domain S-box protein [Flavobacteriia bacterium]|jgi:PAS domain S-box-containing protein
MKNIEPSNFEKLFPFYIEINNNLDIVNLGPSMLKICGDLKGQNLTELFDFVRPKLSISYSFASFMQHLDMIIILECKQNKVRFRGQFIYEKDSETIIYINSPWLVDINDLDQNNLLISDFALHDTVTDNLQLLRSKEITNNDLIKLNADLIESHGQLVVKNENLKIAEEKYKILVESSTDIIFRVNSDGNYIYVNPNATKITGYTEDEIIGQQYTFLLDEKYKIKLTNFYAFQLSQNVENTTIEFPINTKYGTKVWLEQSVNLVKTTQGKYEWIALARDITEKKMAEIALIRSEEKYRSMLENLELGLVEADENNTIVRAYPKFCALVGFKEEEIIGVNAIDLLLDEEAKAIMMEQNAKRKEGKPSVYELQLTKKTGEKVWVMISGAPFYDMNDKFMGTIGIHLDISERKKMEDELTKAKELAENSLKSKEMFLANMSHEIRTPLNAIIGMSELLLQFELNKVQNNYLQAISTSSENLLTLINDILNFSKIDAGKIELEKIPVSMPKIIQNCIDILALKADEKNILLTSDIKSKANHGYLSDPLRLSEIFTNLLSNAIKFTPKGTVSLTCEIEEIDEKFDLLKFQVKDTGIGIPKEKMDLIFEEFTQANESTTRIFGGTGLGLSISKQLVSLLGGTLEVSSEIGKGSTFYFEIKLEKTEVPELLQVEVDDTTHLENFKILVVDDNDINLILAQSILEKWKMNVKTAVNGADAVDLVSKEQFDLILMDIQMPVLDGIGATWMIRNKLKNNVPVIALTANIQQKDFENYIENGMNDILSKPFKQKELYQILSKYLKNDKPKNQISHKNLVDLTNLKMTFNDNQEIITKMINSFLETTPDAITQLKNAVKENNKELIKSIAHKIKPSLDYLSNSEVPQRAREIENETNLNIPFYNQVEDLITNLEQLIAEFQKNTF